MNEDDSSTSDEGSSYNPITLIERRIIAGLIDHDLVEAARAYWRQHLRDAVLMSNGERASVSYRDLHHVLRDNRILRKPYRIERVLAGVFEIRTADVGRWMGLSRWEEEEPRCGYVILEPNFQVWTMHIIDERALRKKARRGELLWRRDV